MEIPNTTRRHEVEITTRAANTKNRSLHPPAPRRPGGANRTDPIRWVDRKKLAIENLQNEWRSWKEQANGEKKHDKVKEQTRTNGSDKHEDNNRRTSQKQLDGERDSDSGKFLTQTVQACLALVLLPVLVTCKPCSCPSKECPSHGAEGSVLRPDFAFSRRRTEDGLAMDKRYSAIAMLSCTRDYGPCTRKKRLKLIPTSP